LIARKNIPRVLVTRPKHQQSNFLDLCKQAGLDTVSLPCIDILPNDCPIEHGDISTADIVLFTSRNAVEFAHAVHPLPWPGVSVHAIGRATQRMLEKLSQKTIQEPIPPYTSEAFIDWYEQQDQQYRVQTRNALIIKGVGGRDAIETYLRSVGTHVDVKEVYKRVTPVVSDAERKRVFEQTPPDIISVTSDDVLRNLVNIAGSEYSRQLHDTPLVVNSERCKELAARLGFNHSAQVASPPGDEGQLKAISASAREQ